MNPINHFLFSFNLLYIFFEGQVDILTMIIFTVLFAILIDIDFLIRIYFLHHREPDLRTWFQEPAGLIFIGGIIGLVLNYFYGSPYFFLVIIPFASHILLDYIGVHNVFPLAPFSKKKVKTGIIKPINHLNNLLNFRELNENYFMVLNVGVLLVFVL